MASATKPPTSSEAPLAVEEKTGVERLESPGIPDDSHMHEETGATGWGGDDAEDGFGML